MTGRYDKLDGQTEGQMTIYDLIELEPYEALIAIHRIFAKARKNMDLAESKAFTLALSKLRFKGKEESSYVYIGKKTLAAVLGINRDSDHLSADMYQMLKNLPENSHADFDEEDKKFLKAKGIEGNGFVVSDIGRVNDTFCVHLNSTYMKLFTHLEEDNDYITLWASDIFQMKTSRSVDFYEHLRMVTDTRKETNSISLGVKALKEMFKIPKDGKGSYVRDKGGFDRANFEKYVMQPVCEDMKNCKMITLLLTPEGKYYEKVKRGNRVLGYRFSWTYTSHPAIAITAKSGQEQDRIDEVPEMKKPEKRKTGAVKKSNNRFNNFEQREYDWEKLEKELLTIDVKKRQSDI